ncbi:Uncharacterized protein HZ326_3311 [Fusarium oxysporum f. sp. albedinis]|nr:Uncharacterized protein HZ326_3311 [Fusarium oxysporum f. sp. albedinis]
MGINPDFSEIEKCGGRVLAVGISQERLVTLIEHLQFLAFLDGVNPHDDHVAEVAGMITGTSFLQTQWTQLNGMEKLAHLFIPLFVNGLFALVSV